MITVLVADDQDLVRAGFRLLLERVDDIEVVAEAEDGDVAVRRARQVTPDVVLMDIRMPRRDGLSAAAEIVATCPSTRVVMLTTFDLDEHVYDALSAGASGFLLKTSPPERLVDAIRTVAAGDALLDPGVTRRVMERAARATSRPAVVPAELQRLTSREREVLRLIARGLSNAEIAAVLVVSEATVKTHVARLLAKLQLRDRVQAVVYAFEHGVTDDSP